VVTIGVADAPDWWLENNFRRKIVDNLTRQSILVSNGNKYWIFSSDDINKIPQGEDILISPTPTPTVVPTSTQPPNLPPATPTPSPTPIPTPAPNTVARFDVSDDGVIDNGDLVIAANNFGEIASEPYSVYDVNQDNVVDVLDLCLVAHHLDVTV
jgi:hypothetical protein